MNKAWEYEKNNYTRISIKLNNKNDSDVIELLNRITNKQGYIKALIKGDMMTPSGLNKFEYFD